MRPFESYFVYSSLLCCLYPCVYTAAVAFVFMMIHMVKEFPRWQFALAYFYVISNVILFYLESTDSEYKIPIGFWGHLVLQLLGVVFVFGSSALACLLPVVTFKSTGKFKVGMEEIHIKDEGQNFLARIFYPTMDKGKKLKYLKHGLRSSNHFAKFARLPSVILSHMTLFKMDVIEHAALISEKESTYGKYFPVVVFSHGLGGTYECYSSFVIELASHGYIVLVPLHNDKSASYVEFPDGNITHYERLPSHKLKVGKNFEFEFRNSQVNHRAQECRVLLDFLHEISSKKEVESAKFSKFFNRVDMDKVAIVGHSFGGATSLQVCFTDQRFRCAIALDTWMLPISQEMLETGIKAPLLMIVSEEYQQIMKTNCLNCRKLADQSSDVFLRVMAGTGHQNFSDFPVFSEHVSRFLKQSGEINPKQAIAVTNEMNLAFLQYLAYIYGCMLFQETSIFG